MNRLSCVVMSLSVASALQVRCWKLIADQNESRVSAVAFHNVRDSQFYHFRASQRRRHPGRTRFRSYMALPTKKISVGSSSREDPMPSTTLPSSLPSLRFITNPSCPFAQKSWIALECVKAQTRNFHYRVDIVDLYGPGGKPDWFWEINPAGTVPVLQVTTCGEVVNYCDSDGILDYLQNEFFVRAAERSEKDNALVQKLRDSVNRMLPIGKQAVLLGRNDVPKELKDQLSSLNSQVLGPYLAGNSISVADCHAFPFLWRLQQHYSDFRVVAPDLDRWLQMCKQQKVFSTTIKSNWWWWW
jgi:glutathione S-transferase